MALQNVITIPLEERNRQSGIRNAGAVPWGTHLCYFYDTKQDLIDILVPYFKAGLENNEFCIWVTSEYLDAKEAEEAIRKAVPDFAQYLERGQIEIIPHTEWYLKDGVFNGQRVINAWIGKLKRALANGYDGMRVTGDTDWVGKRYWRKFTDYEKQVYNIIGEKRMIALCTYSLGRCGAGEIIDVVSKHQFALTTKAGDWSLTRSSERKRAEEEVREFKLIADSAAYGVAIGSVDGILTYVNQSFAQMHGYTPDELVGRHFSILYTEEQMPIIQKLRDQLMQTGSFAGEEMWHRRKDGTVFPTIMTGNLMRDKKGNPSYLVGTTTDITERKQAEAEIRESEERFRNASQIASDVVYERDLQTGIATFYGDIDSHLGYEPGGYPRTMEGWREHIHPEDLAWFDTQSMDQLEPGVPYSIEYRMRKKDGTYMTWLDRIIMIWDEKAGRPLKFIGAATDITERKKAQEALRESEEKYRGLIEDSHIGIAVSDLEGKFTFVNQALCEMTGYSKEESLGRYFINFVHPEDREEKLGMFREGIAAPSGAVDLEFRIIHKKGHVVYMTASPMPFKEGDEPAGVIALITDITQLKRQEELIHELAEVTRQERAEISGEPALSVASGRTLTPLQKKFVKSGLEDFDDRGVIELLTSICNCGRQKAVTKQCFKAFANIREVLSASQEELEQAGFAPQCILYLKFLREIPREVLRERVRERSVYETSKEVFDYLYFSMRDLKEEVFKIA